ncbi:TadE/TadG family type IV pilus assembly protein [Methylopila musalis]|uniref:TadE/TadG family type IV pilus assembly protein n=1 Tax=Methylopila musalis TaxID=1134781 RepID=A0ABW3Z4T6_9HYPH
MTTFPFLRRLSRVRSDERGATAIEFAIISPVLLLIVVGTVETGIMMAAQRQLEDAIFMAARVNKTGYADTGKTQAATVEAAMKRAASGLLDPSKITVTSRSYASYDNIGEPFTDLNNNGVRDSNEPYTDVNGNGAYDADKGKSGSGASGEIVVFTATYPWAIHTPMMGKLLGTNGVRTLSVQTMAKNEPY